MIYGTIEEKFLADYEKLESELDALIDLLADDEPPEGDATAGVKVRTPEPWEVCDVVERISRARGRIDAASDFCSPQVSRQLGNATNELTDMISDLTRWLEGE